MEFKYLKKDEYKLWNEFVDNSIQGSIFSKSWYLDALQVEYKIAVIEDKNIIKAGIILAKNEIKTYANPMLDKYLGIIFRKEEGNRQKIVAKEYKYMDILTKELKKIKSFDYYFHPQFQNWIPLSWHGLTQQTRYTYIISNREHTLDEIYNNFHLNIKRNIKNAKKESVIIKNNIPFEDLWDLVNKTFLRQGSKAPFNREKLENYTKTIKNNFTSYGAYNSNDQCIAVCGLVHNEKSSYLLLNGIDVNNEIRGANAYLIHWTIIDLHDKCELYDFEGSMLFGVEEFYRRFGGELTPYYRVWNDNFFNYAKSKAKKIYKNMRYGR